MSMRSGVVALALVTAAAVVHPGTAQAQKKSRDLITREEIISSAQKDKDLYSAIRSLRPHFLEAPRGYRKMDLERVGSGPTATMQIAQNTKMPKATVYVDGNKLGEVDLLKNILASDVFEVRYMDPAKAQDEFGLEVQGGAVVVTMVKGVKPPQQ